MTVGSMSYVYVLGIFKWCTCDQVLYCLCMHTSTSVSSQRTAVQMPMAFRDIDIVSGSTTKVLQELLSRPDSKHVHLDFLLNEMKFQGTLTNYFDCASIRFEQVCTKSLGKRLLRKMFSLGMTISPEEVAHAVELLPDTKTATLDVIAANCEGPPHESLLLAYVAAEKLNKPQLLECLVARGAAPPISPQVATYVAY